MQIGLFAICALVATQTARALLPSSTPVLLMFEEAHCPYCDKWKSEVGVIYHKTPQGQQFPLQALDIDDIHSAGYGALRDIRYTPTFVLWNGSGEVGRITGYNSEDFFWGLLDQIIDQLPQAPAGK
jgi:thioredoxin-related protein